MNTWQLLNQIRYTLQNHNWTGTAVPVFGKCLITVGPDERGFERVRFPFCFIRPGSASVDPEHDEEQELLQQRIAVRIGVANARDAVGEAALIGGNRTAGTSKGRGLLEVEEELFNAVAYLNGINGVEIQNRAKSAADAAFIEQIGYLVFRDYLFDAKTTVDRFYHPPTRLAASTPGGGVASLTWTLPPDRWDRFRVVLRRAAGATPPATVASGTGVTLASDLATSVSDTPGAGTFSYALFAQYDETYDIDNSSPSTASATSAADTLTVAVV